MNTEFKRISKSQFLKGLQCPKALWLYRHRPDLAPEISQSKQQLFDSGHEVGFLAQKYFEGGVKVAEEYYEIDKAIESTGNYIRNGHEIIYEATASSPDGAYSKIDILRKAEGSEEWDLIEVKQSTTVKDYHLDDLAIQKYAFEGAGYKLRDVYLMHLNKDYIRSGELNVHELFTLENCNGEIDEKLERIPETLQSLLDTLNSKEEPVSAIGRHCKNPFECDYRNYCWQHIPQYSVYNIFQGNKLEQLLAQNIIKIDDIPNEFDCTGRQFIDISTYKNQNIHVDQNALNNFLESLTYPLYYLDYETIFPPIPLFDNSSPYQQIPFQFSLHIQEEPGGDLKHIEFLHTESSDPRPGFVKALVENCDDGGSVIVYNKSFEAGINRELTTVFPEYRNALQNINDRMIDLLIPFKSKHLYHPKMTGSASLKKVLPAFVPELNYEGMEIGDGETASMNYLMCIRDMVTPDEKQRIYANLKAYCHLDTLAEVKLLEVLKNYA